MSAAHGEGVTMRIARPRLTLGAALLAAGLVQAGTAGAASYDERGPAMRALYTGLAVVANVVPGVSALYAPRCLPGYVLCKLTFAGMSLIGAADQLALSGGGDLDQTRAILHRGFAGDWYLAGRHVSGDRTPEPLPDPLPPKGSGGGKWEPPPL
jgi:hypothetical protein